jgi:predicted DNA-binding transcriptional regulator YafY
MDTARRRDDLLRVLRRQGQVTVPALARELGVSERTIFRDLNAIRARGFSVDGSAGRGGGVALDADSVLLSAQLGTSEVVALLLSAAVARATPWMPFASKADQAIAKLEGALPAARVRELRRVLARILIGRPATDAILSSMGPVAPELLEVFERAFTLGFTLGFSYCDVNNHISERNVEPQAMLVRAPLWYILAWDSQKAALRLFRMDRVRSPRVLEDKPFVRRPVQALSPSRGQARPADALLGVAS